MCTYIENLVLAPYDCFEYCVDIDSDSELKSARPFYDRMWATERLLQKN